MRITGIVFTLAWVAALATAVLLIIGAQAQPVVDYLDKLSTQFPGASQTERQPYGGCDEAYRYPDTPGYQWCAEHGYLD